MQQFISYLKSIIHVYMCFVGEEQQEQQIFNYADSNFGLFNNIMLKYL